MAVFCVCVLRRTIHPAWHAEEGQAVGTKLCQVSPKKAHQPQLPLKEMWAKSQVLLWEACTSLILT